MVKRSNCISELECYERIKIPDKYKLLDCLTIGMFVFTVIFGILTEITTGTAVFFGTEPWLYLGFVTSVIIILRKQCTCRYMMLPVELAFFEEHLVLRKKALFTADGKLKEIQVRFDYAQILRVEYKKDTKQLCIRGSGVEYSRVYTEDNSTLFARENIHVKNKAMLLCSKEVDGILFYLSKRSALKVQYE